MNEDSGQTRSIMVKLVNNGQTGAIMANLVNNGQYCPGTSKILDASKINNEILKNVEKARKSSKNV